MRSFQPIRTAGIAVGGEGHVKREFCVLCLRGGGGLVRGRGEGGREGERGGEIGWLRGEAGWWWGLEDGGGWEGWRLEGVVILWERRMVWLVLVTNGFVGISWSFFESNYCVLIRFQGFHKRTRNMVQSSTPKDTRMFYKNIKEILSLSKSPTPHAQ